MREHRTVHAAGSKKMPEEMTAEELQTFAEDLTESMGDVLKAEFDEQNREHAAAPDRNAGEVWERLAEAAAFYRDMAERIDLRAGELLSKDVISAAEAQACRRAREDSSVIRKLIL